MRSGVMKGVAAAVLAATAGSALAQTELYFSEYMYQGARMNAIRPDGTGHRVLFTLPPDQWLPLGLGYRPATGRLVWMDSAGDSELRSAATDGSGATVVAPVEFFARGISFDAAGRIYYSSNNELHRVNADGTADTTLYVAGEVIGNPRVDAINGHVYLGADNHILRMDLDGSNVKTVVRGVSQPRAIGLDIAHGHIYWIDADTHTDFIGRANLDDTGFTLLLNNSPGVGQTSGLIDLLVDPATSTIYYQDELTTSMTRVGFDGLSPTVIYVSPPTGLAPSGLALSTGEPAQALQDCNGNGIADDLDIAGGAPDCDNNGVIDTCQVNPCPARVYVVDQGSAAANPNGRALGAPSQWQVFQPFDVPAGGKSIGEIGIDGYTVEVADGLGIKATIFPDGAGGLPNESQPLGSATLHLRFSTNQENWVFAPLSADLAAGRYWVRIEANNPVDFGGSINFGTSGLQSRSRGASGTFTGPASPIALRLVERAACAADLNGDGIVDFADYLEFLNFYDALDPRADFNGDGLVDFADYLEFLNRYDAGC